MRILHLESHRYPEEAIRQLEGKFELETFDCDTQDALYSKLKTNDYDVIFTRLGLMIDEKVMSLQAGLKYIVTPTTGLNHIDVNAAEKRSIHVISLKGEADFLASIKSTAEHTWGLVLTLIRKLNLAIDSVLQGGWDRNLFLSDELDGKNLGIIGYGRLGKIIAGYGGAFGMKVLVYDSDPATYKNQKEICATDLPSLLSDADVVVLLISWSKANENFMNTLRFDQMKNGAYFINTSRGELVDEQALLNALNSNKIKGAALDVLKGDSSWPGNSNINSPLLTYARNKDNLLITPHMGGYGKDSIERTRNFITVKFLNRIDGLIK